MGTNQALEPSLELSDEQESAIQDVWRKIVERWGDDYGQNQCRRILSDWRPILLKHAEVVWKDVYGATDNDFVFEFERQCYSANKILEDIQFGLLSHVTSEWREENVGTLWYVQSHHNVNTRPDNWTHCSPVGASRLVQATASYLEKPWLQHNFIDWAIINASLFNEFVSLNDDLKSGLLLGKINWAYLIAGEVFEKQVLWEVGLALLGFLVRWIVPPAAVIALLILDYKKAAAILGGLWAIYVLLRFVGLIVGWGERRVQRTQVKKNTEMLDALIAVWLFTNSDVINPKRLREILVEADQRGVGFGVPAVVYSLVDRAIERDPAVFTHSIS